MDMVKWFMLMVQNIKEIGEKENRTEEDNLLIRVESYKMEIGKMELL